MRPEDNRRFRRGGLGLGNRRKTEDEDGNVGITRRPQRRGHILLELIPDRIQADDIVSSAEIDIRIVSRLEASRISVAKWISTWVRKPIVSLRHPTQVGDEGIRRDELP